MAGRKKVPGSEVRSERLTVRWTPSEIRSMHDQQEKLEVTYFADVPRLLVLKQLKLEQLIGDQSDALEWVRKVHDLDSQEEALWFLAKLQLARMLAPSENHVAE